MGYLIGNVFQGFSVSWWKAKHNQHHATPNVAGFDPDIDTMPFLAWYEDELQTILICL
jgi:fatty acid desaturase